MPPKVPTTFTEKLFARLPKEKMRTKGLAAFAISALFFFLALMNIVTIVLSPAKFTCTFTIAVLSALTGLAMWNGPEDYMNRCFEK